MTGTMNAPNIELPVGVWTLDEAQTTVTVSVKKMGLFTVPATLTVSSSRIEVDENHQITEVEIVVDAASYTSGNKQRNKHVSSADFLDSEAHPTIMYHATTVSLAEGGHLAEGAITVKGHTSPMLIKITNLNLDDSNRTATFAASGDLDRNSIGVDKMPSFIIGANLELTISATATKT